MKSADVGEEVSDVELARRKERRRRMREQKQKWGIWKMTFFIIMRMTIIITMRRMKEKWGIWKM